MFLSRENQPGKHQRSTPMRSLTRRSFRPRLEQLEARVVPAVNILSQFTGLTVNNPGDGFEPPDTQGAAGPTSYIETVNQSIAIFSKMGGTQIAQDPFDDFWLVQGGLPRPSTTSGFSDPVITFDDQPGVQRFIVGDQDVDFTNHVSAFDIAVSKTANPMTLTAADWNFYQVNTTQTGLDADYPGNLGFNADALVFTLNMFNGPNTVAHVLVTSVPIAQLVSGSPITPFQNNFAGANLRPTTMHNSLPGDPMWLVEEGGDFVSINVVKMTNVLSNAAMFTTTNLAVNPYQEVLPPLNPNGTMITTNIDSRIMKSAEQGGTLVAAHHIAVSATEDDARWYEINVASGTPTLVDQGNVRAGNNTYLTYPGIDINPNGDIGMSFIRSGTDTPTDFMSMYVTGRTSQTPSGRMELPKLVQAGQANYVGTVGREGDLSGINVDANGTFWASNEIALAITPPDNWGTAVANFALSPIVSIIVSNGVEGMPATFQSNFTSTSPVTDLTATFDFGDGSSQTFSGANGQIINNGNGTFTIQGTHVWIEEGTYNVTVTLFDSATGTTVSRTAPITIADAPLNGNGTTASGTIGEPTLNVEVATFTDSNPFGTLSDFSAMVTWDDGSGRSHTSAGRIVALGGTSFAVFADDTISFSTPGSHAVTVLIRDVGGSQLLVQSTLNVASNPAFNTFVPIYAGDAIPAGFDFIDLENALTNVLSAEQRLVSDLFSGHAADVQADFTNFFSALSGYFTQLSIYDQAYRL